MSGDVSAYYLDGRHPGRWAGRGRAAFGLEGEVDPRHLRAVMAGRDPADRAFLPARRPARRRAGWDLMFGAPKSLSLAHAVAEPGTGAAIGAAHRNAVDRILAWVESRVPGDGLVAACFDHTTNAAAEPHLHTHVLVANLVRVGDTWQAVDPFDWTVDRRMLSALYQLGVRRALREAGVTAEWRLRPDGLADLASVPRAAVRAASTQQRAVAEVGPVRARREASPQPWRERARTAGFAGLEAVDRNVPGGFSGRRPTTADGMDELARPGLGPAVATRLASRRSVVREADVVIALASVHHGGATPDEARSWAQSFLVGQIPVPSPTRGRRWTTHLARAGDTELEKTLLGLGLAAGAREQEAGRVRPREAGRVRAVEAGAAVDGPDPGRHLVERLLSGDTDPVFLSARPGQCELLARAEILDGCHAGWAAQGRTVAVACPAGSEARWSVLAGLPGQRRGQPADVLIVDQADRRPTGELLAMAQAARRTGTQLVFVEGGTLPRLTEPASLGLVGCGDRLGRLAAGEHRPWRPAPATAAGPGWGRPAIEGLLAETLDGPPGTLLVGLGLEEARALNSAARRATGPTDPGPAVATYRGQDFFEGDRVMVWRSGDGRPPAGRRGRVEGAGGQRDEVLIRWDGDRSPTGHRAADLGGVGLGWACTPRLAALSGGPAVVFGPAAAVPALGRRLVASIEAGPELTNRRGLHLER